MREAQQPDAGRVRTFHEVLVGRVALDAQVHSIEGDSSSQLKQAADRLASKSQQTRAERDTPGDVGVQVTALRQGAEQQAPHRDLQSDC